MCEDFLFRAVFVCLEYILVSAVFVSLKYNLARAVFASVKYILVSAVCVCVCVHGCIVVGAAGSALDFILRNVKRLYIYRYCI